MSERPREPDLFGLRREETSRGRRRGKPVDLEAEAAQRTREQEQKEDEAALLAVIESRDYGKLMAALKALGLPETRLKRVAELWARLPRK